MTRTAPPEPTRPPRSRRPPSRCTRGPASRSLLTRNLRQSGIYIAFVAIVVLFTILTDGVSLSPGNITNIVLQNSYILILAIGMVLVIIAGHIDLSVGLGGRAHRRGLRGPGHPAGPARGGSASSPRSSSALAVGAWQGFWVAYVGIPAFIVTLAGMLLFRGLTLQVLGNISLSPFPAGVPARLASGFLNGLARRRRLRRLHPADRRPRRRRLRGQRIPHPARPASSTSSPSSPSRCSSRRVVLVGAVVMDFAWQLAHARGLPIVLIILAVLVARLRRSSRSGPSSAARSTPSAATCRRRSCPASRSKVVNFWIFVNMGFLAAVAGVIFAVALQRRPARRRQHVRARRDRRRPSSAARRSPAASARWSAPWSVA